MKKFLCLFLAAAFAFAAVSCSSDGGSDDDNSISSLINNGGSTVDLTGKKIKEDVSVNSTVTIKNADFGGNTLTVNAANVVLENVKNVRIVVSEKVKSSSFTIKGSNGEVSVVVKGGSSIVIKDSTITSVSIEGADASVDVSDKTKVDSVEVKAAGAAIKGGEDSSIGTVTVDEKVETVDVADGKIENVKAGENVVINVSGDSKIDNAEGGKFIAEDDDVKLPKGVNPIKISSVTLKQQVSSKTEYEIGDRFDYSGLSVSVKYSDETTREISLNANNVEISGFNSSSAGPCTVSFVYKGFDVEGTLSVTIKPSSKLYKNLLNEGIDLLFDQKYDEGVAKIKEAYNKEQNDETKLYYALAEIATISTDGSVSNIMKNNFGVKNYPSTLNALINGEWLKDYKIYVYEDVYTLHEVSEDETYYCVKVSGDRCDWDSDGKKYYIAALLDEDNEWVSSYEHGSYYLKNISLDENGKYLVYVYNLPEELKSQIQKKYLLNYDHEKGVLSYDESTKFPDFNVPEWLKNSDRYKESLVKSTQTSATTSLLLWGNLVECNPNGANELIDNILKIFDGKFENAKKLAASISEGNVLVPSKVISALCLEDVLGDSSVYVGKSELNVLISSMQILKGAFQWISSYDLSANVSSAKELFGENPKELEFFRKLAKTNSLKVRNSGAMETSKKTFIEAVEILENSYNYLVSSASSYPQAAKDEVARYGNVILAAAENLNKCLENGEIFYIPNENPFETLEWNASSSNSFGIDMGKLFTAGYFSDIFERDGSDLKIDCVVDYYYYKSDWTEKEGSFNLKVTSDMKTSDDIENAVEKEMRQLVGDDYVKAEYDARIGLKINSKLLSDLLPGLDFERVSMIPMAGFGGYFDNY